jgi:hypothetical protein
VRIDRLLCASRGDGRVGRRRACPICLALTRPELSGEVVHATGCHLQRALNEVEAFITSSGRTRDITAARASMVPKAKP